MGPETCYSRCGQTVHEHRQQVRRGLTGKELVEASQGMGIGGVVLGGGGAGAGAMSVKIVRYMARRQPNDTAPWNAYDYTKQCFPFDG